MPPVDLLAFGPHPDDLEIGMGATIAHHVARGLRVGLCDLTRGEMGSNGTPGEREREAEAAREVLGADWRVNLGLPDRHLRDVAEQVRPIVELIRACRPSVIALPHWGDRHPDHTAACTLVTSAAFSSGLRRYEAAGDAWKADWLVHYFINTPGEPSFVVDVSEFYEVKQRALACHVSQFAPRGESGDGDAIDVAAVCATGRKPRRAVGRAGRRALGRRVRRARAHHPAPSPQAPPRAARPSRVRIGIVCYASTGGSGIVATELAIALADRGHDLHVLSTEPPFRFPADRPNLRFHEVATPAYPLFREPQYALSLATAIVQVSRQYHLDVVHAHYAVPHAAAAYLARQIMIAHPTDRVPCVMTTLHGTDITLVGSDPSYTETVAFCIDQSDGVTAVSESLKADTCALLGITREITVIPNFLDGARFARRSLPRRARRTAAHRAHLQLQARETHRRRRRRLRARARAGAGDAGAGGRRARARAGASAAA